MKNVSFFYPSISGKETRLVEQHTSSFGNCITLLDGREVLIPDLVPKARLKTKLWLLHLLGIFENFTLLLQPGCSHLPVFTGTHLHEPEKALRSC